MKVKQRIGIVVFLIFMSTFITITDSFCIVARNNTNKLGQIKKALTKKTVRKKRKTRQKQNLPSTFGKTHFIVGFPHGAFKKQQQESIQQQIAHLIASDGTIKRALFSPDDKVRETLISLIESEQDSIKVAIFSFTEQTIAQALIKAATNNIHVELITDPSTLHDPFNKINQIAQYNVNVFIYKPLRSNSFMVDKMHNKFILFSKNVNDKSILWTGSLNFTKLASTNNQENVLILDDAFLIDQFNQHFNVLKNRSERYKAS